MPSVRQTSKGKRTRERILGVAEGLFARQGFHGTSVRDLAEALEMPTASLLHYYPSKERLYGALLERVAAEVAEATTRALGGRGSHAARLRRLCRRFLAWSQERPERSNLLLRELLDNRLRLETARSFPLAPVVGAVTAFVREGQRAGAFRRLDPLSALVVLAGAASYAVAAGPTLARISGRTPAGLARTARRDLRLVLERALLEEGEGS